MTMGRTRIGVHRLYIRSETNAPRAGGTLNSTRLVLDDFLLRVWSAVVVEGVGKEEGCRGRRGKVQSVSVVKARERKRRDGETYGMDGICLRRNPLLCVSLILEQTAGFLLL